MAGPKTSRRPTPFASFQAALCVVPISASAVRTIAIVNQKGGCGKTTTAINLAAVFARRGWRTLLVDMDPQSHCAAGLGVPEARIEVSIGESLIAAHDRSLDLDSLSWEVGRNLHLIPSTTRLAALEAPGGGLHDLPDRDRRLEMVLSLLCHRFDVCLIDCPPTIGLLTFNALRAAGEAIIPVETGFFSMRGAQKQCLTIQKTIERIGRPIACHLLPTLHDAGSRTAREVLATLEREFAGQLMPVVIHEHEALREAASFGQPVVEYAPRSRAEEDFERLATWLEAHGGRPDLDAPPEIEVVRPSVPAPHAPSAAGAPRTNGVETVSRVAELLRRVEELADKSNARWLHADQARSDEPKSERETHHLDSLFGVRQASRGTLFVQPAQSARSIAIAGDFNGWSSTSHPLRYNSSGNVFQGVFNLPAGRHRYQLIVDGEWRCDPYNALQDDGPDGCYSVLQVTEPAASQFPAPVATAPLTPAAPAAPAARTTEDEPHEHDTRH
jgi:chromosome partitioning protein